MTKNGKNSMKLFTKNMPVDNNEWHTVKKGRGIPNPEISIKEPILVEKFRDTTFNSKTISPSAVLKHKKNHSRKQPRKQKKQSTLDISSITVDDLDAEIEHFASKSNNIPTTTFTTNNPSSASSVTTARISNQSTPTGSGANQINTPMDDNDSGDDDNTKNNNGQVPESENTGNDVVDFSNAFTYNFAIKYNKNNLRRQRIQPCDLANEIYQQIDHRTRIHCVHPTNNNTAPPPNCIFDLRNLPKNDYEFKEFHLYVQDDRDSRIFLKISIDMDILTLKRQMLNFLQDKRFGLKCSDLYDLETVQIGTIENAHPNMDCRITMEGDVNCILAVMHEQETTPDHIKNQITNLSKPMKIQVKKGYPFVGGRRIDQQHVIITWIKSQQAVVAEALAIIGETALKDGRKLIPITVEYELGAEDYYQLLQRSTNFTSTLQRITVLNITQDFVREPYKYTHTTNSTHPAVPVSFEQCYKNAGAISIVPTNRYRDDGRFIIIVEQSKRHQVWQEAGKFIERACADPAHKSSKDCSTTFQQFPRIHDPVTVTGQASAYAQRLRARDPLPNAPQNAARNPQLNIPPNPWNQETSNNVNAAGFPNQFFFHHD